MSFRRYFSRTTLLLLVCTLLLPITRGSATPLQSPATEDVPVDLIILTNGDRYSGRFVRAADGKVTFHSDVAGDLQLEWAAIQELRVRTPVALIPTGIAVNRKMPLGKIASGYLTISNQRVTLRTDAQTVVADVPVNEVQFLVDQATLDKELRGAPGWRQAWNGALTAGAALVRATQDAYNVDGSLSLVRAVPAATWMSPRHRTSLLLSGVAGKITQPEYISSTPVPGTVVAEQVTKTDIYHARLQRDQYFLDRVYYFGVTQFDHNFSQNLQLQQLYGAGLGWTALRRPAQTLDLTANIQYVRQTFIESQPGDNKNLVGSTLSANYVVKLTPQITFTQYAAFLPAFNDGDAYSIVERNTLTLPAYRNFRFVIGTVNSYLNTVAVSEPPSKRNSFQLTFGLGYDIKSSY